MTDKPKKDDKPEEDPAFLKTVRKMLNTPPEPRKGGRGSKQKKGAKPA